MQGEIVSDLFGEEQWFGSAEAFWTAQNAAVQSLADPYREAGWTGVMNLAPGGPAPASRANRGVSAMGTYACAILALRLSPA